jgi:peptidyl-prolyl cis-trans isomerase SurA
LFAVTLLRAHAQSDQTIVAVVNDEAISMHDLQARLALIVASSNLEDTPEMRQRIVPEVLRMLIDESLKRQEARRQNIPVTPADIDRGIAEVGRQLSIPPSEMPNYLSSRGLDMATLLKQIQTEIAWIKLVNRTAADRARVDDREIDEEQRRVRQTQGGVEYRIGEIFLPIDDTTSEAQARELAARLVGETRSGASFAARARNFSRGPAAEQGGDLGWVRPGQIDPRLETALGELRPGQVSDPIVTEKGVFIVLLIERRTAGASRAGKVAMHQVFLPLSAQPSQAEIGSQVRRAEEIRQGVDTCAQLDQRGRAANAKTADLGTVEIDRLPPEVQRVVMSLAPGEVSQPLRATNGVILLMVCSRQAAGDEGNAREQIRRRLTEERLTASAQRLLRELRRNAFLDIRLR